MLKTKGYVDKKRRKIAMKLTCDLCGGDLLMNAGGQSACCNRCGLAYSKERLKEKLVAFSEAKPQTSNTAEERFHDCKDYDVPTTEPKRMLRLRSKRSLILFRVQAYLDGEPCAMLKNTGSTVQIPISQGEHEIAFQVFTTAGRDAVEPMTFHVGDRDLNGEFSLHRGAFRVSKKFEIWEDA